eukprot:TRINITY_DN9503_c0_g1_i1.p1 TRINITY_DN9503_c0_g1~~TRINITY_DN9503_c0_g1_i1.p1  ORF type:complete len:110 (+),score=20.99 TRINITY_DN9503_c0_g1_i1:125-454(+)
MALQSQFPRSPEPLLHRIEMVSSLAERCPLCADNSLIQTALITPAEKTPRVDEQDIEDIKRAVNSDLNPSYKFCDAQLMSFDWLQKSRVTFKVLPYDAPTDDGDDTDFF